MDAAEQQRRTEAAALLRVGAWVAYCCDLDLHLIEDEKEVAEIRESLQDEESWDHVWETREQALADPWLGKSSQR